MILNTMSPDAIISRLKDIIDDIDLGKRNGLRIKYAKALANRKVADGSILGVSRYTIDDNNVYVVASKQQFGRGKRQAEMVLSYYVTCMDPHSGKISYLKPYFDVRGTNLRGYGVYTSHCLQRLNERAGETFLDFISKWGSSYMSMQSNDGENNFEGKILGCPHKFFGYVYGNVHYITTMVTEDMCYDNQLAVATDLEAFGQEYIAYKNRMCA